ncbi:MAG: hypothetical protein HC901_04380, partial [Bdellovibrionaceae bacterium]|nr:hypothetical protein [Pseudobdellovibrionaceae bacterium]
YAGCGAHGDDAADGCGRESGGGAADVYPASAESDAEGSELAGGGAGADGGCESGPAESGVYPVADFDRGSVSVDGDVGWFGYGYYLAGDPAISDHLEVGYVGGVQEPYVEEQEQFDMLGLQVRSYIDFGVGIVGARGIRKHTGAASG